MIKLLCLKFEIIIQILNDKDVNFWCCLWDFFGVFFLLILDHSLVAEVKKQTVFFLLTAEVWSTSSATDVCRCGPQTADVLHLKNKQHLNKGFVIL
ncbi:hypothetical protein Hanom_Chr08g00711491 [Helianthus anomalus]